MTFARPSDLTFMTDALAEARAAAAEGDVPVGAVLVRRNEVIARAGNRTERDRDATAHAELLVLRDGARIVGDWRLEGCTLYVTMEPCAMCAGAIVLSRITRVVFGSWDEKAGMAGSVADLLRHPRLNHRPEVLGGVHAEESAAMLTSFFQSRRAAPDGDRQLP